MNVNEKRFYDALENLFVGAKIEGEGGYVNLLKIKSEYYKKILNNSFQYSNKNYFYSKTIVKLQNKMYFNYIDFKLMLN